jgi:hypothetical protein
MSFQFQSIGAVGPPLIDGFHIDFTWLGMAILPAVAGKFRDFSGSPAAPMLFAAAMMALGLAGQIAFRAAQRLMKP